MRFLNNCILKILIIKFILIFVAFNSFALSQNLPKDSTPSNKLDPTKMNPGEIYRKIREQQLNPPARIFLNQFTSLTLPKGFSFIPTDNSEILLNMMGNKGGQGLKGLIVHTDDFQMNWYLVIRDIQIGYITDSDADQITSKNLIEKIRTSIRQQSPNNEVSPGITQTQLKDVEWIIPPEYDKDKNTLSWLLQTYIDGVDESNRFQQGINYNSNLLYRYGFIQLNFSSTYANVELGKDIIELITSAIKFDFESEYQDFDPNKDIIAPISLSQLITGKKRSDPPPVIVDEPVNKIQNHESKLLKWFYLLIIIFGLGFIGYEIIENKIKYTKN